MESNPQITGANLNWGTMASGSCSAFGDCAIESGNSTLTGNEYELLDNQGYTISAVGFNQRQDMTFTYYAKGPNSGSGSGTVTVSYPEFYDQVTITNATGHPYFSGSVIIAKNSDVQTVNNAATKVTVNMTKYSRLAVS